MFFIFKNQLISTSNCFTLSQRHVNEVAKNEWEMKNSLITTACIQTFVLPSELFKMSQIRIIFTSST